MYIERTKYDRCAACGSLFLTLFFFVRGAVRQVLRPEAFMSLSSLQEKQAYLCQRQLQLSNNFKL